MIENVSSIASAGRATALHRELALLERAAEALYVFPEDKERSRVADSQGLVGASRS